ncbi:MAG: hypothetical protein ACI8XZ_004813 [Gammaproteobacteria bacterium]|jgi:hypothetical protein
MDSKSTRQRRNNCGVTCTFQMGFRAFIVLTRKMSSWGSSRHMLSGAASGDLLVLAGDPSPCSPNSGPSHRPSAVIPMKYLTGPTTASAFDHNSVSYEYAVMVHTLIDAMELYADHVIQHATCERSLWDLINAGSRDVSISRDVCNNDRCVPELSESEQTL